MSQDIEIKNLTESFAAALTKHGWKKKKRFFNFTTIENFIYHLPAIKDRSKKELACHNLQICLQIINEMDESEEPDAKSGDELFSTYLLPLVSTYQRYSGFALFVRPPFLLMLFLIAEAIAFSFEASLWVHLLVDTVILSWFMYQYYKIKQKKVYGLFV